MIIRLGFLFLSKSKSPFKIRHCSAGETSPFCSASPFRRLAFALRLAWLWLPREPKIVHTLSTFLQQTEQTLVWIVMFNVEATILPISFLPPILSQTRISATTNRIDIRIKRLTS